MSKAPAEVVATEMAKLAEMEGQLAEMDKQMGAVEQSVMAIFISF